MTQEPTIKKVVVLGALSAIAQATMRLYAKERANIVLVGRDSTRLSQVAQDLIAHGASACRQRTINLADATDAEAELRSMFDEIGGSVDLVLLFYGVLGDQKLAEDDPNEARRILNTNFNSAATWCLAAANLLEQQRKGCLVVVSSVAGDRGRQSNYVYGAAKAGLTTLVQGLAHRLADSHARAVVAKLGLVDTPMTAHMRKGPLWTKPARVASKLKSVADREGPAVVYIPWFWRWVMLVIRSAPESILHRTKL